MSNLEQINEASYSDVNSINKIITTMIKILGKRLGKTVYGPKYPFSISATSKYGGKTKGIYFVIDSNRSFRLNFIKKGDWIIQNIEFWEKPSFDPQFNYKTDELSTVETLDLITAVFGGKTTVEDRTVKKLIKESTTSFSSMISTIYEATAKDKKIVEDAFAQFLKEKKTSGGGYNGGQGALIQDWIAWADKKKIKTNPGQSYYLVKGAIAKGEIKLNKLTKQDVAKETGAKKSSGPASKIPNNDLPEELKKMLAQFALTTEEKYEKMLLDAKKMMTSGTKHAVICSGSPGVGKSFDIKKWAKSVPGYNEEEHYFRGTATESAFLEQVYFNRNAKLLFFDDCDDVFTKVDPNIWKGLLENERIRKMTITKQLKGSNILKDFLGKEQLENGKYKTVIMDENEEGDATYKNGKLNFEFKPKVIFITNLDIRNDPKFDKAVIDRVFFTEMFMTNKQIAQRIEKIMGNLGIEESDGSIRSVPAKEKKELLDFIMNGVFRKEFEEAGLTEALSIRKYLHALEVWTNSGPRSIIEKSVAAMFLKIPNLG